MTKWIKNWFSNFEPFEKPLVYDDLVYTTPEHFFQAMKNQDKEYRIQVSNAITPGGAKRLGRQVRLRLDWEWIKLDVMEYALRYKFGKGTFWREKLDKTIGAIVENNNWHDNYWGNCTCPRCPVPGQNHLGRLLMKIRDEGEEDGLRS